MMRAPERLQWAFHDLPVKAAAPGRVADPCHNTHDTPSRWLIPNGEHPDTLTGRRVFRFRVRDKEREMEQERDYVISEWWKFVDDFTVHQAALLIVGVEPNSETGTHCKRWPLHQQPDGYGILTQALSSALINGDLDGRQLPDHLYDFNENDCGEIEGSVDIQRSTVKRDSLVRWLSARGHRRGFFFPETPADTGLPDYLNPDHPRYSDKLAAAVRVWQAMDDETLRGKKGLVPAMTGWLESRYKEFRLVHKQSGRGKGGVVTHSIGDRNDGAIKAVAQVANWKVDGGAMPAPESANLPTPQE